MNTAVWAWMLILLHSLDAGHAPKKHAVAGSSCKPRELTGLTKTQVEASLKSFDEANGKHLGTWSPGFPELQVNQNTPLVGAEAQCSLLFMAQGVESILEDQRDNLNPKDVSLHRALGHAISRINLLAACVKSAVGGTCSPRPSPPPMPQPVFERKQWSHTLLKAATDYLIWLERKFAVRVLKAKAAMKRKIKQKHAMEKRREYLEGSALLL